jgi:hypothetical protein
MTASIPNLIFKACNDKEEIMRATEEYKKIWEEDKAKIINSFQKNSRLVFKQKEIRVFIDEARSMSGLNVSQPLRLRASYSLDKKKATLIHELGHRLLFDLIPPNDNKSHHLLFLFLYDVWTDLYGEIFAKQQVEIEKNQKSTDYETPWVWVLSMTREERNSLMVKYTHGKIS